MGALAFKNVSDTYARSKLRVLVLDDDAFDRKRLRRWIERSMPAAAEIFEAYDLTSFSEQVASNAFDLVLLDYGLADGTGLDALAMLRGHAQNATSYAVMVSGREDEGLQASCLSMGCDHFVKKSVLNQSRVGDLLRRAEDKMLDPAPGAAPDDVPSANRTALDFWANRARQRADHERARGGADNITILNGMLGVDLRAAPEPVVAPPRRSKLLDREMSQKLRLFITDFLSCDEFEFMPSTVSNSEQHPELD